MENFVIIADANCELEEEDQKSYNVEVLPGHVVLPDKTEILAMPKWDVYTAKEFYTTLKKNPDGFITSPTNVAEFEKAFETAAQEGKDVLCLTISSGISGAYNFANQAALNVQKKYQDAKIEVIDSQRFGIGFGLMVVCASKLRSEGKSLLETTTWLEENKNRFHQAGWLDDLTFVAKKGRMTDAKAFLGTIAGIKPIGEFDSHGLTTVIGKVKGSKKAYSVLLSYIKETIINPEEQTIFIAQTDRYSQAEIYKKMIEEELHPKEVVIKDVHISSGANIGPGLMAAYYIGKEISSDLREETRIIDKYNKES